MSWKTLFRKYRSGKFSDLVGQDHITKTLENAIKSKKIASAYLFCGPRGTGKTSAARIMAKSLNCYKEEGVNPCEVCDMCRGISDGSAVDVIEIDAASNTQVEKVREFIIQKVAYAPTSGRYKIYIIDEVHKLSDSAFNALLKTLEEPPSRTIFILATTHPHKLLPTILSRCQRFEFKKIGKKDIIERLRSICESEKIDIDNDALELISEESDGSLRDALVFLEQISINTEGRIDQDAVISSLALVSRHNMMELITSLIKKDTTESLRLVSQFFEAGHNPDELCKEILLYLRAMALIMIGKIDSIQNSWGNELTKRLIELKEFISINEIMIMIKLVMELKGFLADTTLSNALFDVYVIRLAVRDRFSEHFDKIESKSGKIEKKHAIKHEKGYNSQLKPVIKTDNIEDNGKLKTEKITSDSKIEIDPDNINNFWLKVMKLIKMQNPILHALLLEVKPVSVKNGIFITGLKKEYSFHFNKLNENKEVIQNAIRDLSKQDFKFECINLDDNDEDINEKKVQITAKVLEMFNGEIV